jgi:4-diphosphocytidyl-2-C-methyl-D-erythritol kinase
MIEEIAPAKINLFLHVGPVRADGLHDLESLFVFAEDGDRVRVAPAQDLSLDLTGPFASALSRFSIEDNLVLRAASMLRAAIGIRSGARITLDKRLPIASGIGGGSADAAAALRALIRMWRVDMDAARLRDLAFKLGSDVPACLDGRPVYVSGAGEKITPGPVLPPLWTALVNPGRPMPTGPVFRAFDAANPQPARPDPARRRRLCGYDDVASYLSLTRNDLEPPATAREQVVGEAAAFLTRQPGCIISRMSGSGATVFGLYTSPGAAASAARKAWGVGFWSMAAGIRARSVAN